MGLLQILFISVALSMDAFAVSVSSGILIKNIKPKYGFIFGAYFGFFQGFMVLAGFFAGKTFSKFISSYDHWIAFLLLSFIGGKMLLEANESENVDMSKDINGVTKPYNMLLLSIATSIDAMAVGVSFAFFSVKIYESALIVALTTFICSFAGVYLGNKLGSIFQKSAERLGGIILICIGIKILIEHIFFQ